MSARDLFKTKLCTLYARGSCDRPNCTFAHGEEELRKPPPGYIGKTVWCQRKFPSTHRSLYALAFWRFSDWRQLCLFILFCCPWSVQAYNAQLFTILWTSTGYSFGEISLFWFCFSGNSCIIMVVIHHSTRSEHVSWLFVTSASVGSPCTFSTIELFVSFFPK